VLAATRESFADRVGHFAPLVSLLLVFITIFTQQRAARLRTLWDSSPTRGEAGRAAALNAVVALLTSLVLLSGWHLWRDALDNLSLLPKGGDQAARELFFLAWLFLAGLVLWQLYLVWDALALFRNRPPKRRR
jgi:hypothetical protein